MKAYRNLLAALLLFTAAARAASVPEPGTVFYGEVIARHAGHEHALSSGTLTWTITSGTTSTTLSAEIAPFGEQHLYRMEIPHSLLASGLTVASGALPIGAAAVNFQHASIRVNGAPAAIRAPGTLAFSIEQLTRAATHRLDLEVTTAFEDADGDGLPDWWEERYGVDDPSADPDGDGRTNLAEYAGFTDPTRSNREPLLFTREVHASADATSALLVHTLDEDSSPAQLVYQLTSVPAGHVLRLRNSISNPDRPDRSLMSGDTFTQADIDAGRLIVVHPVNAPLTALRFGLTVRDSYCGAFSICR